MAAVDFHHMGIDAANIGAQLLQNLQAHGDIGDLGNVFNPADAVHQQGGGDDCNGGVFGTTDFYFTKQGSSTLYNIFSQNLTLFSRHSLLWRQHV